MAVTIPGEDDKQERSLAMMIRAQFTEYDARNVLGHTEIPKRQLPAVVMMMTLQETLKTLVAKKPERKNYGYNKDDPNQQWLTDDFARDMELFAEKMQISSDAVAMLEHVCDRWIFSYGLAMRSIDRKIRAEGVKLGSAQMAQAAEDNVGMGSKFLQSIGLGRLTKFKKVYVDKEGK
jgi:hypothetical protein